MWIRLLIGKRLDLELGHLVWGSEICLDRKVVPSGSKELNYRITGTP